MALDRRDLLTTLGAAAALARGQGAMAAGPAGGSAPPGDTDYFLSATNPVANVDQRDLEALALDLMQSGEMAAARKRCAYLWRAVVEYDAGPAVMQSFEAMIDEFCFRAALLAANSDAAHPRVLRLYTPPAQWFGRSLPGSRWGGDNPDNCYRIIPVDAGGTFELHGRRDAHPASYVTYQIVADTSTSQALGALEGADVETGADGRFVITLDGTPAGGRRNHLPLPPGSRYLFIRDSVGDWSAQTPNWLRVVRTDAGGGAAPAGTRLLAERAAEAAVGDVPRAYWVMRLFHNSPTNTFIPPRPASGSGGMISNVQESTGCSTLVAPDEALIVTANDAGAAYRSLVYHDYWFRTVEPGQRQTCYNNAQMQPDASGEYTFVVAHRDPGVANWIDSAGQEKGVLLFRWQGLPPDRGKGRPHIATRLVKLADLPAALPSGVARMTPAARGRQMEERRAGYARRYAVGGTPPARVL